MYHIDTDDLLISTQSHPSKFLKLELRLLVRSAGHPTNTSQRSRLEECLYQTCTQTIYTLYSHELASQSEL